MTCVPANTARANIQAQTRSAMHAILAHAHDVTNCHLRHSFQMLAFNSTCSLQSERLKFISSKHSATNSMSTLQALCNEVTPPPCTAAADHRAFSHGSSPRRTDIGATQFTIMHSALHNSTQTSMLCPSTQVPSCMDSDGPLGPIQLDLQGGAAPLLPEALAAAMP